MRTAALAIAVFLIAPVPARAQATQRDAAIVGQKVLGSPGGTSSTDAARPGLDAVLEAGSDETTASIRLGTRWRSVMLDVTLSAGIEEGEKLTSVAEAATDPLSDSGALAFGATWVKWQPEMDAFAMLAVCKPYEGPCATNNEKLPAHVRNELLNLVDLKTAKTFGIKLRQTRPAFTYRPDAAAADTTVRHGGTEATVGGGILWPTVAYAGLSAGYERSWEPADDSLFICKDIEDTPTAAVCAETVLGPPVPTSGAIVAATVRFFHKHFVVAPRFEHRVAKAKTIFELPIYFIPDSETAALTGGAAFRLTNGRARIFVFVGTRVPSFGLAR